MTDAITWAVPGRVIHWKLDEGSTVEELTATNTAIHALLDESDAERVHMLIDISRLNIAKSVLNGPQLQGSLTYQNEPNWGYTALYGSQNVALKMIIQMFSNIMRTTIRFAETQAEAYETLRQADPTLPAWEEAMG